MYLAVDFLSIIHFWVDATYRVHWDCNGHTKVMMSMGKREIPSVSRGHKLNTGSSIEAELVGIADALGIILWANYFMKAQGYHRHHRLVSGQQVNHSPGKIL